MKRFFVLSFLVTLSAGGGILHAAEFESDILPIFSQKCGRCHLDGNSKGGVSLDLDKIDREIGRGKVIIPSDSGGSDLVRVVSLPEDDGDRMPPKGAPLSDRDIAKIKEWIDGGARIGNEPAEDAKMAEQDEAPKAAEPVAEAWTDTNGRTITATLMRVDAARKLVVLKLENGRSAEVPISKLSDESRERARAFWESTQR